MIPIRLIASATLVSCGLAFTSPALPAPAAPGAALDTVAGDGGIVLAQYPGPGDYRGWRRDEYRDQDRDRGRDRLRDWDGRGDRPDDRDGDRRRSRDRDQDRDWDRDRHRSGDRDWRHRHDRYRHRYDRHERWRVKRHPRRPYWRGRHLPPRGHFFVITNYWDYYLPPPPYGHYYVRVDNDVFLVMEATRLIIDAFILFELLGR